MKLHSCMMMGLAATLMLACGGSSTEAKSPQASEGSSEAEEDAMSDEEFWAQEAEATEDTSAEQASDADMAEDSEDAAGEESEAEEAEEDASE